MRQQRIHRQATVTRPARVLYDCVNDVAAYPTFLPWCAGSVIHEHTDEIMDATLVLEKAGIKKSFRTRNQLTPHTRIEMQLVDGPFRYLNGVWQFESIDARTATITFTLDFEFSSKLTQLAFGGVFHQAVDAMVEAFVARAMAQAVES